MARRCAGFHRQGISSHGHVDFYNGWLEATDSVDVRARVRGHIAKVGFTDGQIVKKGDLLFQLDPRPFEADLGRARDELRVAQAQKVAADKDYERMKALVPEGAVSQTEADKSEANALSLAAKEAAAGPGGSSVAPVTFDATKACVRRRIRDSPVVHQRTVEVYSDLRRTDGLTRAEAVLVAQLRSGHSPVLAEYRARVDGGSPDCSHCGGGGPETLEH